MRQLISRFQRTSCTPRNISLNTPKYAQNQLMSAGAASMMSEMLPGYGVDESCAMGTEDLDPNCFEVSCVVWIMGLSLTVAAQMSEYEKSLRASCDANDLHGHSLRRSRKFSPDDQAAIEAAVEIALLLSNSSQKNAETLVKTVLTDNFNLLSSTAAIIRAETLRGQLPH